MTPQENNIETGEGGGGGSNGLLTTESAWKGNFLNSFVHDCSTFRKPRDFGGFKVQVAGCRSLF